MNDLDRISIENAFVPKAFSPDVLKVNGRNDEERLASGRMIAPPNEPTPTVLGLLVLGKSPQEYLPSAEIEFVCHNGVEITQVPTRGSIFAQLQTVNFPYADFKKMSMFHSHFSSYSTSAP
ncbi:MAG: hypothetical protein IJU76_02115 [Desulfovibrionaceae bacterium]|nr:hypothetical protein [Desulfovibrionaceae bacterium]